MGRAGPERCGRHLKRSLANLAKRNLSSYSDIFTLAAARGFLLAKGLKGAFTPIEVPGAPRTLATGNNDHGQLVGAYENPPAAPASR